jgi:hypothetical protein
MANSIEQVSGSDLHDRERTSRHIHSIRKTEEQNYRPFPSRQRQPNATGLHSRRVRNGVKCAGRRLKSGSQTCSHSEYGDQCLRRPECCISAHGSISQIFSVSSLSPEEHTNRETLTINKRRQPSTSQAMEAWYAILIGIGPFS